MSQPTEPVEPTGPRQPSQVPPGPSTAGPPPPRVPPPVQGGAHPAGPPPRGPGLWKQATSTTGGLIALIVAACLAGLLVLGIITAGVAFATHVVAQAHRQQVAGAVRGGAMVPPDQRKRLGQGLPRAGKVRPGGPGALGGLGGGLNSLQRGAAGLGAVQHGEFTVQGTDGKPSVMTLQRGTVTKASSTSVTVKSTDGFTATYAIDANTRGARAGVLAAGDTVMVIGQKAGAKAVIIRVIRTG